MKQNKHHWLTIILTFLMLFSEYRWTPTQAASLSIEVAKITAARGQTVDVPVFLDSLGNVRGLQFEVHYDNSMMKLTDILIGKDIPNFTVYKNVNTGRAMIVNISENIPSEKKEIAILRFLLNNQGPSNSEVSLHNLVISDDHTSDISSQFKRMNGQVMVDEQPPTIVLESQPSLPTNGDVTILVSMDGTGSAIAIQKWAEGDHDQDFAFFEQGGHALSGNSFVISQNGTYTVYAEDALGNQATQTITITNIDRVNPIVNGVEEGKTYGPGVKIQIMDGNDVTALLDGEPYTPGTEIYTHGEHVIQVTDASGNQTVIHFYIDAMPPSVNGIQPDQITNQTIMATFTEGIAVLNNQPYVSGTPITSDGSYLLEVTDKLGNKTTISFIIDKQNPAILLDKSEVDLGTGLVTITTAIDGTGSTIVSKKWAKGDQNTAYFQSSGNDFSQASFFVGENSLYTVYAKDAAGNESVQSIKVIVRGDINRDGMINVMDLGMAGEYIVENISFQDYQKFSADINQDNRVNALDWIKLAILTLNFH